MKTLNILTTALVLGTSSAALGATAFLSQTPFGGGAVLGNPSVMTTTAGGPIDLHMYFAPDASDEAYIGLFLDVRSATPGVADITSFSVEFSTVDVPNVVNIGDRWEPSFVPLGGEITTPERFQLQVGAVLEEGLNIDNNGSGATLDSGYDPSATAFYLGSITLTPVGVGVTDLSFHVGDSLVARAGDTIAGPFASLTFGGGAETPVLGNAAGATGSIADATITVVPEPSTTVLLGAGLLFGLLRRRRV